MASKMRSRLPPVGGTVCLALFGLLTVLVHTHATAGLDRLFLSVGPRSYAVKELCRIVGKVASPQNDLIAGAAACAAMAWVNTGDALRARARDIVLLAGCMALSALAVRVLKPLFSRVRPSGNMGSYSFPSAHAIMAFSLLVPLACIAGRRLHSRRARGGLWLLAGLATAAVGLSRVFLHRHYVTDILGSYLFGGFLFGWLFWITRRFGRRRESVRPPAAGPPR